MYGKVHTLIMVMELDGNAAHLGLNDTSFTDEVTEMYRVENMEDGDHQLLGRADRSMTNGTFSIDHFECGCPCSTLSQVQCANNLTTPRIENSSGDGFDLVSAGPNAQNVPAQAVIVDESDPSIIYHNKSQWFDYFTPAIWMLVTTEEACFTHRLPVLR